MIKKLAVIGGGPIGLVSAIKLARKGHEVHLYELGSWPRDKVCGQGIMPSGVELLKDLGINFYEFEDSYSFEGVHYIDKNIKVNGLLPSAGLGIERKELSNKLYKLAQKEENLSLFPYTKLLEISQDHHDVFIELLDMQSNKHFCARYDNVFAADGLNSSARKLLKQERKRKDGNRMGARVHFDLPPWSKSVEVYWSKGVEAYVTPISKNRIEVSFMWYEHQIKGKEKIYDQLINGFPNLKEKLAKAQPCSDFKGIGPFKYVSKNYKVGRVFLLGDAYRFFDGITGEGISLGLISSDIIVNNFENLNLLKKIQINYLYFHYKFIVNLCLKLSLHTKLRKFLFKLVEKRPTVFDFLLAVNDKH